MILITAFRILLITCVASAACLGQPSKDKYEVGNVMAAQIHESASGEGEKVVRYDVTLHIGNTEYVVLYTPPNGRKTVEYHLGRDSLFLVRKDTIVFHDLLG